MSRKIILIKQELLLLVYELNRSGLLAERSEERFSRNAETDLVCRLLLEKKKEAKPEATETYLKVAKFYGEQGFYLKAVADYKQKLKLDTRMVEVNTTLAELTSQPGLRE